jgi:hypothetical protein
MRFVSSVALVVACAAFQGVEAQTPKYPNTRHGFTIAFGLGVGSAKGVCDGDCDTETETSGTGFLRIGGAVRNNLVLSGQVRGWYKEENNQAANFSGVFGSAQWYPAICYGWYVEGGVGVGGMRAEDLSTRDRVETTAPALMLGTGYDVRLTKNFSLTPFLNLYHIAKASLQLNGSPLPPGFDVKVGVNVTQIGFGFTWH